MSDQDDIRKQVSSQVLGSMGKFSGDATINWLKNISEDIAPDQAMLAQQSDEPPYMSMVCCVDTLFDHFQRYQWEYNKGQKNDDLSVKANKPKYDRSINDVVKCQGFLETKEWALMIEAEAEKILAYIIKRDLVDDFSARREHFTPFLELYGTNSEYGILWKAGSSVIYFDHLSFIAKKIFARLIRVSKGEASELEPFQLELPQKQSAGGGISQTLNRIRYASSSDNSDEVLDQTWRRLTDAFHNLQVIMQQDLQEMTKMGVMALRSGNQDLNRKLTKRTKVLTELNNQLDNLHHYWQEESS